jgi:hypothetical protein
MAELEALSKKNLLRIIIMVAPSSTMKTLDGCSYKDLSAQPFNKGISLAVNTPQCWSGFLAP